MSYHVTMASRKGRDAAAKQGADPRHVDALMTGNFEVAGEVLKPLTLAVTWAMEKVGSAFIVGEGGGEKVVSSQQLAITALCFANPQKMYSLAKNGQTDEISALAFDFAVKLDVPTMRSLNAWINAQIDLNTDKITPALDESESVGKPEPEPEPQTEPEPESDAENKS